MTKVDGIFIQLMDILFDSANAKTRYSSLSEYIIQFLIMTMEHDRQNQIKSNLFISTFEWKKSNSFSLLQMPIKNRTWRIAKNN